jgi:hypothetical protein
MTPEQAKQALFNLQQTAPGERFSQAGQGSASAPVVQPGGEVLNRFRSQEYTIFERMFRILPAEGWFSPRVRPARPLTVELGSYVVPRNRALWLFDYSFSVYRPSGVDPGDFLRAEVGRFSNQLGFDLTIAGDRLADIKYELDPHPDAPNRTAFAPVVAANQTAGVFNRSAANAYAVTAGPGSSLLPVRRPVQGAEGYPFTFVVIEGQAVALSMVIFNRLRAALSAVEGRMGGYLLERQLSDHLINSVRPR